MTGPLAQHVVAARDFGSEARRLAPRDPGVFTRLAQAEALLAVAIAISGLAGSQTDPAPAGEESCGESPSWSR